jgi:hypothetical protein
LAIALWLRFTRAAKRVPALGPLAIIAHMNHMHILEMEQYMEHELREAATRHFPLDWKEDAITHDLLIRLRNGGAGC